MTEIRSALFWAFLICWTLLIGLLGIILLPFNSTKLALKVGALWSKVTILALRFINGVQVKLIDEPNIPKIPCIIASKHQSAWETIFFVSYLDNAAFVLKKELLKIPIYGTYLRFMDMIAINRKGGGSIIKQLSEKGKRCIAQGRSIVIFPEGTRVNPGSDVEYKSGIAALHKALEGVLILPVALNSGHVWPPKSWRIKPGTIKVQFLKPIKKKMDKAELLTKLKKEIDSATNSL